MLTIHRQQVKRVHGPACTCRGCRDDWREFRAEQERIDERVMRDHMERCGYFEPCEDIERTWEGGEHA